MAMYQELHHWEDAIAIAASRVRDIKPLEPQTSGVIQISNGLNYFHIVLESS